MRLNTFISGHLERCPDCGYLLTRLPQDHVCPECGHPRRSDQIVLWGWGYGALSNPVNTRTLFGAIFAVLLPVGVISGIVLARGVRHWITLAVWALVGTWIAYSIYKRKRLRADHQAPAQLRLAPEGFGQRDGFGKVISTPWTQHSDVQIFPASEGHYVILISEPQDEGRLAGPESQEDEGRLAGLEFQATAEEAEVLERLIQSWRAAGTLRTAPAEPQATNSAQTGPVLPRISYWRGQFVRALVLIIGAPLLGTWYIAVYQLNSPQYRFLYFLLLVPGLALASVLLDMVRVHLAYRAECRRRNARDDSPAGRT